MQKTRRIPADGASMKKYVKIIAVILAVLPAVFFLPVPRGTLDDGGTRVYAALTYKIVVWNKLVAVAGENGTDSFLYHRTSVFLYTDNLNPVGELWNIETQRHPVSALS